MKNRLVKYITFILSLVIAFTIVPTVSVVAGGNGIAGVEFYSCSTMQAVKQDEDKSKYSILQTLSLRSAKGETEGAQFFINANKNVNDYDITLSDLTFGSSVISKENVDVYVEIYTLATDSALFVGTYGGGIYPDCLIPIEYIKSANQNNVKAGLNQGFWIDVRVPENAESGVYNGTLTFKAGKESKDIPLTLEVFDFVMPEAPGLATCYLIWDDWLLNTEFDNTTEKHWDYYKTLLEYNISGYVFPSKTTKDFTKALTEYYDKVNMYGVPYRAISKTVNDWDYYLSYMLAIGEQCKKDGVNYFDKAYYYFDMFYDEATSFDWRIEQMKSIIETTDEYEEYIISQLVEEGTIIDSENCEIANTIRGLQHAITTEGYMHDTWEGILDMYVQHSKGFTTSADIAKYESLLNDPNYTVWGYTTELCDYPNPAVNIPGIPVTARDVYWFNYEVGITGELYWCTNCNLNCTSVYGLGYAPIYNPYTNAMHDGVSNGGGYYLYPGMHYGSDKPFPSMRLAVKRDGIDDYTYMTELEKRYVSSGTSEGVKSVVSFMNQLLITSGRSMINELGLMKARNNLAKLIELYDAYGLVINSVEYVENGINLNLNANDGVSVKVNGIEYSASVITVTDYDNLIIECKKGEEVESITFDTKVKAEVINGFEDLNDNIITVQTNYGSRTESSSKVIHSGTKSEKVVLSGYTAFADPTYILAYKPSFYITLSDIGLSNGLYGVDSVGFYVYNNGTERTYEVYIQSLVGGLTKTIVYDRVTLKPNVWTKIDISNFNMISLNDNDYKDVIRVGLRTDNLYMGLLPSSQTLYVDDVYIGGK